MKTFSIFLFPVLGAALFAGCGGDGTPSAAPAAKPAEAVVAKDFDVEMRQTLEALVKGDGEGAEKSAAEAAALRPDSAEVALARGQAAFLRKDAKAALAHFDAVAGARTLPAPLRGAARAARGVVEMSQKSHDAARLSFLRALRLDPRNAAARYHLGRLLQDVFRFEEAAAEQFALAAGCPDAPAERVKKIRGEILPPLVKAIEARRTTVFGTGARDEKKAAKLVAEGDALLKRNAGAAVQKYEAAFAADRTCEAAALKLVDLLPKHDRKTGVDKALEAYRVLITLRPSRSDNYYNAALLAFNNKRWAVAAKLLDRGVAHHPDNIKLLDLLVSSLMKAGKTREQEGWSAYRDELKGGR